MRFSMARCASAIGLNPSAMYSRIGPEIPFIRAAMSLWSRGMSAHRDVAAPGRAGELRKGVVPDPVNAEAHARHEAGEIVLPKADHRGARAGQPVLRRGVGHLHGGFRR